MAAKFRITRTTSREDVIGLMVDHTTDGGTEVRGVVDDFRNGRCRIRMEDGTWTTSQVHVTLAARPISPLTDAALLDAEEASVRASMAGCHRDLMAAEDRAALANERSRNADYRVRCETARMAEHVSALFALWNLAAAEAITQIVRGYFVPEETDGLGDFLSDPYGWFDYNLGEGTVSATVGAMVIAIITAKHAAASNA